MWLRNRRTRGGLVAAGALAALVAAADRLFPPDLSRARVLSQEVQAADGETLNLHLAADGLWRLPATAEMVSPVYLGLLLRTEDKRFWWHPGVDPLALARAAWQLIAQGRIVSGGSTLTMQVARLLVPHRHTLWGKLLDSVRALQLEARYSKPQILSLYLTLAPCGGNIEGVRAASLLYFDHGPEHLTPAEAALLVALPQSPSRRRPDRHPAAALAALRAVFARAGMGEPARLPAASRRPAPREAPHFAALLRRQGATGIVRSTIDADLQHHLAALVRREQPALGADAAVAAVAVRPRDGAILAYVGGADRGSLDLAQTHRSPGSALKPFLYALAFDDTLITPDTLIEDAPLRIADYAPNDFDRGFRGTVTAREALQQSYNLPAVTLLNWIGAPRFAAVLAQAGARLVLPPGAAPTLPLALGGAGISLADLTMLYAGLAAGGMVHPPRARIDTPPATARPMVSARAAGAVADILRGAPRPDGVAQDGRAIAYKTGTSYGFRDAWALGFDADTAIGIWVGRPDGTPRPGAFARATAAPLLFRAFEAVPPAAATGAPAVAAGPLAPALLRLPARAAAPGASDLRIIYPPRGARLAWSGDPLALEAAGGARPYRWTVNAVPLAAAAAGLEPSWRPDGPGFSRLTLTDARHAVVQEDVWIEPP